MSIVAVYDACVLYPAHLRDLLIRAGVAGLVQPKWTEQILDETFRSILASRPDLNASALERTRALMNVSVRDVLVDDYERWIPDLELPDPDDRHVLAAVIASDAQFIVTFNLAHFPQTVLERFHLEAQHPDQFITNLIDTNPDDMRQVIESMLSALQHPRPTVEQLLGWLRNTGLGESRDQLTKLFRP